MAYIKEIRDLVGHRPLIMTSASGALLDQQGAVLLQERADTGDWGFPGGYMEFGESFEQTVKREFKEDAGIEIVPVNRLAILDQDFYAYPNGDRVQQRQIPHHEATQLALRHLSRRRRIRFPSRIRPRPWRSPHHQVV